MTAMDDMLARVAAEMQRRYYGKYRGFVVDNDDPQRRGRLRLRVPSVLGDATTGWALPCLPYGGMPAAGLFLVPQVEAQVWVEFEEGVLDAPIWVGTFWQPGDVPGDGRPGEPTTYALQTAAGHLLQLDDTEGEQEILMRHATGASVRIGNAGTISVTDKAGSTLVLDSDRGELRAEDANGNRLAMTPDGVTVEDCSGGRLSLGPDGAVLKAVKITLDAAIIELGGAGGEPLLKGQSFLSLFSSHVHPAAPAPTGPPTPPPLPPPLSLSVTAT